MRAVLTAIITLVLLPGTAIAQAKVLDGEALFNQANRLRTFKPKDQFDIPPSFAPLRGREFKADIPLSASGPNSQICVGIPHYTYDADKGLTIHYGDTEFSLAGGLSPQFSLGCTVTRHQERQGNAFGATALVEVEDQKYIALEGSNLSPTLMGQTFTLKIGGSEARSLVRAINIRIKGTISEGSAEPIQCRTSTVPASFETKIQTNWDGCHISVIITSIELVGNSPQGEVIRPLKWGADAKR